MQIRKVKKITEELCGLEISRSQVSRLAKGLDEEIAVWRSLPLKKEYPLIQLIACSADRSSSGAISSVSLLSATSIRIPTPEPGFPEPGVSGTERPPLRRPAGLRTKKEFSVPPMVRPGVKSSSARAGSQYGGGAMVLPRKYLILRFGKREAASAIRAGEEAVVRLPYGKGNESGTTADVPAEA